jgi:hypothetical protein
MAVEENERARGKRGKETPKRIELAVRVENIPTMSN